MYFNNDTVHVILNIVCQKFKIENEQTSLELDPKLLK